MGRVIRAGHVSGVRVVGLGLTLAVVRTETLVLLLVFLGVSGWGVVANVRNENTLLARGYVAVFALDSPVLALWGAA
jgi:hypothetical protein